MKVHVVGFNKKWMAMIRHKREGSFSVSFLFAKTISEVLNNAPYRLLLLPKTQGLVFSMTNQLYVVQMSISATYMKWMILKKSETIIMKTYVMIQCVTQH